MSRPGSKNPSSICWPDRHHPEVAAVHVTNELDMAACPTRVWAWIAAAPLWPEWYPNASNVVLDEETADELSLGAEFCWKTFGVSIRSTVREFDPVERIAWDGRAFGVDVYHAWLLTPSDRGTIVLTEETQTGVVSRVAAAMMPGRMHRFHQMWLERLEAKAVAGAPN